jgi:hypothetical protein
MEDRKKPPLPQGIEKKLKKLYKPKNKKLESRFGVKL